MPLGNAVVSLSEEVSLGTLISHALLPVTEKSVNADSVAAAEEYPFPSEKASQLGRGKEGGNGTDLPPVVVPHPL